MWKEFGIKPNELDNYDQDWIEKMIIISNADDEEKSREIESTTRFKK